MLSLSNLSAMTLASPLEQFEMVPLMPLRVGTVDLSMTNSSLRMFMAFGVLVTFGLLLAAVGNGFVAPSRWQAVGEGLYAVVQSRMASRGPKAQPYFPFLYALFTFMLALNVLGLMPYSFAVTSHMMVTLTFSTAMWIGKLIMGFRHHGLKLFGRFLPAGAPRVRNLRLVPLEVRGFCMTMMSLSVRLFANRRAGHMLLKVRAGFAWTRRRVGGLLWVAHFLPLMVLFMLRGLETAVAAMQAYVFTLLTARFMNDVLEGGH